jgi:uncharacterized protein (UPF0332 family)
MAFADDLLEQANHLANRERRKPRQASLRRAVSTAYYALFHLLISEATLNWRRPEQRSLLARMFEHGKMKAASERQRAVCNRFLNSSPPAGPELDCARHLLQVAATFFDAQQQRHAADYDNSVQWTRTQVKSRIAAVEEAFESWRAVRDEPDAQAYLISLLGNPKVSG